MICYLVAVLLFWFRNCLYIIILLMLLKIVIIADSTSKMHLCLCLQNRSNIAQECGLQGLALNSRTPRGQILVALAMALKWSCLGIKEALPCLWLEALVSRRSVVLIFLACCYVQAVSFTRIDD